MVVVVVLLLLLLGYWVIKNAVLLAGG